MAKGRKTGGKPFKKGCKPGPGRPKLSKEAKGLKKLTADSYIKLVIKYLNMPLEKLVSLQANKTKAKKLTILELWLLNGMISGARVGALSTLENNILARVIGRIPSSEPASGNNEDTDEKLKNLTKAMTGAAKKCLKKK